MGMYTQLHLHAGDDVKFEATTMQHNHDRIDLAITHRGGFLTDLSVTMTRDQAKALRAELSRVLLEEMIGAGND